MNAKISNLVIECVKELGEELTIDSLESPDENTRLFGERSGLDSLGLVGLIAEIEERLSSQLDLNISLADERAMSQKRSPFRRVGSLCAYIEQLVNESGGHG